MTVRRNIIANYLGSGWSGLMGLVFIPLYIRYLGMESYGLIGVFASLQAWMVLLDLGLAQTLSREMARFLAGTHTAQRIRDLLRSMESIYVLIAAGIALSVALVSQWLAGHWLQVEELPLNVVVEALSITGVVIALRWMGGLYRGAIMGLQAQVWLNGCNVVFATLRGVGVVGVLAWISPTIQPFFIYQGLLAALETLVLGIQLKRLLPKAPQPPQFSWNAMQKVWRFAAGISLITVLTLLLTQIDKLLLSKLLPLTEFGYYTLASTVAGALFMVITPISGAISPRFAQLVASNDTSTLADAYHRYAQLMTITVAPAAFVISFFSDHALLLWTRDAHITATAAPIVSLLILGTFLNGLMHVPYQLQLAYGWTRFPAQVNTIAVILLVPAIYWGATHYGPIGAAAVWALLNAGYVTIALPLMHRRLLPGEQGRWYGQDVLPPVLVVLVILTVLRQLAPAPNLDRPLGSLAVLAAAAFLSIGGTLLSTPVGRQMAASLRPGYHVR